jgi:serine/threonine-protein kinase
MAPEAIAGVIAPGEQYLVDVYSLGIVAYEMLTGHVPFDHAQVTRLLLMHLQEPTPDPRVERPDTPQPLAHLVREMLAKDPKARPQRMEEIAWRLRRLSADRWARPAPPLSAVVAEDNPATAAILAAFISAEAPDAEVHIASDGVSALRMVRSRPPDVLVVDLHLPAMNGIELCFQLAVARESEWCPVLCTSAHATTMELEALHRLPFVRFAPKGEPLTARLSAFVSAAQRRATRRLGQRHEPCTGKGGGGARS